MSAGDIAVGGKDLEIVRARHHKALERSIESWKPLASGMAAEVVEDVWRVVAARPAEFADERKRELQLATLAKDCLAWRLLAGVRSGDHRAFTALMAMYRLQAQGMIRAAAGVIHQADLNDIEQEVWLTVWVKPPERPDDSPSLAPFQAWLRKVAQRKTLRFLERRGAPVRSGPGDPDWLFEQTRGGGLPPHMALAAAVHAFRGFDAERIVQELGGQPLRELLRMLAGAPARLDSLAAALEGELGGRRLEEFYPHSTSREDQVAAVEKWIRTIDALAFHLRIDTGATRDVDHSSAAEAGGPGSDPWKVALLREAVRIALEDTDDPHATVAYLLNRFLGLKPEAIAAETAARTLDEWLDGLPSRLAEEYPLIPVEQWTGYFEPLRRTMGWPGPAGKRIGDTAFADYFRSRAPAGRGREITAWVCKIDQRFRARIHDQEEVFLTEVFSGAGAAHRKIAFAFHEILKVPGDCLPWISRVGLSFLTRVFLAAYANPGEGGRPLARGRVEHCLRQFRKILEQPVRSAVKDARKLGALVARGVRTIGLLSFQDCLEDASPARKTDELLAWSASERARVIGALRGRGAGLIYAYVCAGL